MKGFVVAQQGHVVNALPPVSASGGKTAQAFSMADYQHATIIISLGAQAAQMTSIVVNECTSAAGAGATAIPFNVFKQEVSGASDDVLGALTAETSAGFQPSANANIFYVIELDAQALDAGYDYVQVVLANGANVDLAAVIVVLSGARFAEDQSPTVCV
jgi:hypothetical protein